MAEVMLEVGDLKGRSVQFMNCLRIVGSLLPIIACAESSLKSQMKVPNNPIESKMYYYHSCPKTSGQLGEP